MTSTDIQAARYLTVAEVADLLQVHQKTVVKHLCSGGAMANVAHIRLGGRTRATVRIRQDSFEEWLKEAEAKAARAVEDDAADGDGRRFRKF